MSTDPKTIEPLNFPRSSANVPGVDGPSGPVPCLFCDASYDFPATKDEYLAHLYLQHNLIISEVSEVAILPEYLAFWRLKFEEVAFDAKQYCTTLLLNHLPDRTPAPPTEYFLLDDNLPLDRDQRVRLHRRRLETVLARHQLERSDQTYERLCLFCRDTCQPTRAAFVEHLFRKHFLHLGRPENLVYIDELIDDVRDKLQRLVCLFCAKTFKDRPTLKEHMRKKGHKRINPDDKQYDKYYMCNYTRELKPPTSLGVVEVQQQQQQQQKQAAVAKADGDDDSSVFQTPDGSDSDWSDWEGDADSPMRCLFCAHTSAKYTQLTDHMRAAHGVDLDAQLSPLTFHKKVKLVNYVRHRMHARTCVTCEAVFEDDAGLVKHLSEAEHYGTGEAHQWDQPNFLFPLFEEDPLLFCLDDALSSSSSRSLSPRSGAVSPVNMADGVQIYAEEICVEVNEDAEALSKELMMKL